MSFTIVLFVLGYIIGLFAALVVDGVFAIYVYQIEYLVNPRSKWWGSHLPDLRYVLQDRKNKSPVVVEGKVLDGEAKRR